LWIPVMRLSGERERSASAACAGASILSCTMVHEMVQVDGSKRFRTMPRHHY
jgi:hypothetical protein